MRKPRNRSLNRINRRHDKQTYMKSANIIQTFFKNFLRKRYDGICINFDDDDIFTYEPVSHIPRELLIVVEEHGFNALNLLLWIMRSTDDFQVHPITRNKFDESTEILSIYKIATFLRKDSENFKWKKGYYRRRKHPNRVLTKYAKKIMKS